MGKVILEVRDLKTKYVTRFREDVYNCVGGLENFIEDAEKNEQSRLYARQKYSKRSSDGYGYDGLFKFAFT